MGRRGRSEDLGYTAMLWMPAELTLTVPQLVLCWAHSLNFLSPGSAPSAHPADCTTTLTHTESSCSFSGFSSFPLVPKKKLLTRIITGKATVKCVSSRSTDSVSLFDRPQTRLRQKVETKCRYIIRGWCAFSLYLACNYTISAKITDAAIKTCILIWEHKNN